MIVRTLDEALETRIQEKRTHVRALNTTIRITDTVKGLGEAVMNEDYSALRGELLRLISLSESLLAVVAGCEDSLALPVRKATTDAINNKIIDGLNFESAVYNYVYQLNRKD